MAKEWINRKAFRITNRKFRGYSKVVRVQLPVIPGNGFRLGVAVASPLLWVKAVTCSAHPARQQNQAIAPLPLPGLPFTHRVFQGHPQSTLPCLGHQLDDFLYSCQSDCPWHWPLYCSWTRSLQQPKLQRSVTYWPNNWKVTAAVAVELVIPRASEPYRWT